MDGVLVVNKPAGMTSHDVVDQVRKVLKIRKVGHGGTLDPDATGVLVLGVGKATRFLSYAQSAPKRYLAGIRFGVTTTTQDASGDVLEERPVDVDEPSLRSALEAFKGEIEQVPPMVSAVKIGGEKLYEKARRGETIERPARKVTIYELELKAFDPGADAADIDVTCSGGTYIRTLAADLGERLGCGAHLTSLRRVAAGGFRIEEAIGLDEIEEDHLLPLVEIVRDLPAVTVEADEADLVRNGRPLEPRPGVGEGPVALIHSNSLMAVYTAKNGKLVPERVVSQ